MKKTHPQDMCPPHRPRLSLKPLALATSLLFLGAAHTAAHADAGLTDLGSLVSGGSSEAYGVNAAGDVVVGDAYTGSSYHAFRWEAGTMTDLGTLVPGNAGSSKANGVNALGDVVVGQAYNGSMTHAFRWTLNTGMTDLGTLKSDNTGFSTALGVNAAGDVVVGYAATDIVGGTFRAFRWTLNAGSTTAGTMTDLGTLNSASGNSFAYGVNAAGDVVVGSSATGIVGSASHAFRWTLNDGMTDLGTLNGTTGNSIAYGVNAAGNVVVGSADTGIVDSATHAFRWTLNAGSTTDGTMTDLGTLAPGNVGSSSASAVNAAGDVVVGQAYVSQDNNGSVYRAFRWTQTTGMQSIEDWLKANNVAVDDSAPKTYFANGVNAAGDVVVGLLTNYHAFIATTKGLIDLVENARSLAGSAGTPTQSLQDASLVIHGAHGSPMRGLLSDGKQSFWTAGDWGRSDNQGNDGDLGAVEIGYARGINDQVMVKLALGRTYSKQDTLFGGTTQVDGTYLMPEIIAKLSGTPLYATFSGYVNAGEADIKRGYDNAGTREYGRGSADTRTTAVRARLDWLDAVKFGNTALTPYTSVTYTRTKVDAYSETGGAFPANWNSRSEHSTEARLGLDAVHGLDDKLNLLGRLEGVHRFNDTGAAASGDVAGLFGFSLPGQTYKRNWMRAAVGLEGKMGQGTGSLMVNGSTQSDSAKYWLAASYKMDF